jgi:hypothetical protein
MARKKNKKDLSYQEKRIPYYKEQVFLFLNKKADLNKKLEDLKRELIDTEDKIDYYNKELNSIIVSKNKKIIENYNKQFFEIGKYYYLINIKIKPNNSLYYYFIGIKKDTFELDKLGKGQSGYFFPKIDAPNLKNFLTNYINSFISNIKQIEKNPDLKLKSVKQTKEIKNKLRIIKSALQI